jgi:hypothetical protein
MNADFRDRSASDAAMSVRVTDQGEDRQKRDDEAQRRHPIRPSVNRT